jgi:hypothetical protein
MDKIQNGIVKGALCKTAQKGFTDTCVSHKSRFLFFDFSDILQQMEQNERLY